MQRSQTVMEWEQRGEQRGELRARRSGLLEILQSKFGTALPADIRQAIETQQDLPTLVVWFRASLVPDLTLEDLRQRIGLNGHPSP